MKRTLATLAFVALAGIAQAHPHFNKTVSAVLPGDITATITYNTTPANELRAAETAVGVFVTPRAPKLKLSADLKSGETVVLAAGEYVIGVIKSSATDWTLALYNGALARGAQPDPEKVIKLDSLFESKTGTAEHMLVDITPGHGKFAGKAVLTLHFGSLFLQGLLL